MPQQKTPADPSPVDAFVGSLGAALHAAIKGTAADGTELKDEGAVVQYVDHQLALAKTALQERVATVKADASDYPDMAACVADNQDQDDPEGYCAMIMGKSEDVAASATKRDTADVARDAAIAKAQTAVAKATAEAADATRRAKAAEERIQKMEDAARAADALARAKGLVAGFGGATAEELAPLLQQLGPAEVKIIEKLCTAGRDAVAKARLTEELGVGGRPTAGPLAELDGLAKEIAKAEKLPYAQAYDRALAQRPDLYDASLRAPAVH